MTSGYRAIPDQDNSQINENHYYNLSTVVHKLKTISSFVDSSPVLKNRSLIKLIGLPKHESEINAQERDSPCLKDVRDAEITIKPPLTIIGQDEQGRQLVDVIDSQSEDPFTLDSFERTILLHKAQNTDFIIARVATADPNDEKRFYFSYYSAHHINKVLFRTQPEEGLLHRMKARNPLNNMIIIGDVHYYIIRTKSVPDRLAMTSHRDYNEISMTSQTVVSSAHQATSNTKKYFATLISKKISSVLKLAGISRLEHSDNSNKNTSRIPERIEIANSKHLQRRNSADDAFIETVEFGHFPESMYKSNGNSKQSGLKSSDRMRLRLSSDKNWPMSSRNNVRSFSYLNNYGRSHDSLSFECWLQKHDVMEICNDKKAKIDSKAPDDVCYVAEYLASDDDYLMKSVIREIFLRNALEPDDASLFTISQNDNFLYDSDDSFWNRLFRLFLSFFMAVSVWIVYYMGKLI